jgi:hypothetical protein
MRKTLFLFLFFPIFGQTQQDIRMFVFGNSLINHTFEVSPPTPSQETSVPHWFQLLTDAGGHTYAVDGQFGFLPQHRNVPPIPQWGFDIVDGVWDADLIPFSAADFTHILLTPANFLQWQAPNENFPGESFSPVEATQTVFEWCANQEDNLSFYIYENWADMAPYLSNGFPPTDQEWAAYNAYVQGEFSDWFLDYYEEVATQFPNECVRMIPVGTTISRLLQIAPFNQIPITELYEDDAPHGRPTIYFLAALITYSAMYEERAPMNLVIDPIIHETVRDNYEAVVDFVWNELLTFTDQSGNNLAFCTSSIIDNIAEQQVDNFSIQFENPVQNTLTIQTNLPFDKVRIHDLNGSVRYEGTSTTIDVSNLPVGVYILSVYDRINRRLGSRKCVKIE